MSQIELVVELSLSGSTKYYSFDGLDLDNFYEPRILSVGSISKEVSILPRDFRISGSDIELDNSDGVISELVENNTLRNRTITYKLGDKYKGPSDFTAIYTAKVVDWHWNENSITLITSDLSYNKFNSPFTRRVNATTWSNLPDSTPTVLLPHVAGTVTSENTTGQGALIAYLVDPGIGQSKYRYITAAHAMKSIDNVYRYGVLLDNSLYTITNTTATINGSSVNVTYIDFDVEQRDSRRSSEPEITYDGKGITDDGTSSGTLLTDPGDQFKEIAQLAGFSSGDFDSTSFAAAKTAFSSLGIVGSWAVTSIEETLDTVRELFAQSFMGSIYLTGGGKIALDFIDGLSATASATFTDEINILEGSVSGYQQNEVDSASQIDYEFVRDWAHQRFDAEDSEEDSAATTSLGETIIKPQQYWYISDPVDANYIAQIELYWINPDREFIEITVSPDLFQDFGLNDVVNITHFSGTGDQGYEAVDFRVVSITYQISYESISLRLGLVDHPGLSTSVPSNTLPTKTSQDVPQYFGFNSDQTPTFKVEDDGSGFIGANDDISWDSSGNVTIGGDLTVSGDMSLTGSITLSTTSHIKGGQTAYDTGTGFWLGYDSTAYKFSLGDSSGTKVTWDGSALSVTGGTFTAGTIQTASSGSRLELTSADGLRMFDSNGIRIEFPESYDRINFYNTNNDLFSTILSSAIGVFQIRIGVDSSTDGRFHLENEGSSGGFVIVDIASGDIENVGDLIARQAGSTSLIVDPVVGSNTAVVTVDIDGSDNPALSFFGNTAIAQVTGYTAFSNLSTDRTCDADSTSVEELADILGTLIEDLKDYGLISN